MSFFFFFFNDTATTEIYTLSLHDALPIFSRRVAQVYAPTQLTVGDPGVDPSKSRLYINLVMVKKPEGRSEEHTSELQSRLHLVCRLLLEKKKKQNTYHNNQQRSRLYRTTS